MANISEHFTAEERRCKCGKCDGAVTEDAELIRMLESARRQFGGAMTINSWCRCPAHNEAEGGKPDSAHLTGKAVDIACSNGAERWKIVTALIDTGFVRIGIAKSFVHADIDAEKPKPVIWPY
jgi:uncharacterized protein YcbK (DUF882 family)